MKVRVTMPDTITELEGEALFPPTEGRPFLLMESGNPIVTLLETSNVVAVLGDGFFVTKTGAYRVRLLEGPDAMMLEAMSRRAGQA